MGMQYYSMSAVVTSKFAFPPPPPMAALLLNIQIPFREWRNLRGAAERRDPSIPNVFTFKSRLDLRGYWIGMREPKELKKKKKSRLNSPFRTCIYRTVCRRNQWSEGEEMDFEVQKQIWNRACNNSKPQKTLSCSLWWWWWWWLLPLY